MKRRVRAAIARGARALSVACGVSVAGVVSLAPGCGGGEAPSLPEELAPPPAIERPAPPAGAADPLYDAEGDLLESETRVAGLALPRGLETVFEEERRHVYRSDVPLAKLQRYFGVRLVTGQVDTRPNGSVTYVDALPRGVRGGEVRLDVTVEPVARAGVRVEVRERVPPSLDRPSEEEALRMLQERLRSAD